MPNATKEKFSNTAPTGARPRAAVGGPAELAMDLIDEDPYQPRSANNPGFSAASLAELAASIHLRKVKTPISVRDNPQMPGRFIINHGARRFRASRLAGNVTIPAFIDNDYNEADQVVENLQRNELTAREIADYIGRELAKGRKKGEIAIAISKSPAFVTQHATLLDLPGPLAAAFSSGRVNDVTMINELATVYRKKPRDVTAWLDNDGQEITRGAVKLLRAFLDDKLRQELPDAGFGNGFDMEIDQRQTGRVLRDSSDELTEQARIKRPAVQVRHDGRVARMMLHRRPTYQGQAWLKYMDDGQESEVDLAEVTLDALLEE